MFIPSSINFQLTASIELRLSCDKLSLAFAIFNLVALTFDGDYWAIQCKCYKEGSTIDKPAVDSFLATSGRAFKNENLKTSNFSVCLWIDTTGKSWGKNAEEAIRN